ncbi:FAD-dependent oxidoreductase [Chitinibacter fontanus]|uniref:FAD-dependent oxidoreductase n=1 Tax=Chitinibacter fontanus TaxID=1737446 RepID=A0A7D5VBJ5_9NEIS|nr:FAD-dependent oxidoreductase [Chitinibacter fontanus]QLI82855.1 FAD-dependent oxidoreductase [Chitinibacter fontanus]
MSQKAKQRIAVIGSGISGLASAYFLSRAHEVVLFEAGNYLGGHTNTVEVTLEGQTAAVDTGFLVFNEKTYPNLIALLAELGVGSYATDMSFGVSLDDGRLEWAGTNLDTVFAQRSNLLSTRFIGMLRDILRFNAAASANLEACLQSGATLGQLLESGAYGAAFRDAYLLPMAAAIWSSSPNDILDFPAATFLRFCLNHALLQVNDRPQWQTVRGGGREYVRKIAATLSDVRLNTPVSRVERTADGVMVYSAQQAEQFDAVVFATHAPQTLAMLVDASEAERAVLSAVRYQANTAVLHTDIKQLPKRRKVWSAWNYLGGAAVSGERPVCVSYLLNQLQNLPFVTPVVVTLNPFAPPAAETVLAQFEYEHPVFDQAAIDAQARLPAIQGVDRVWFAGAWTGYGFHEDGLKSALRVVADFGLSPEWAQVT